MSGKTGSSSKKNLASVPEPAVVVKDNKFDFRKIIFPVILGLLFFMVYAYIFDTKVDLNGDNANYFSLGKALATGQGYVNIASPAHTPENHFPPGYPVLISLIMRVFGESIVAVKIFNGLFVVVSLILLYFITEKITGHKTLALVSIFLLILNYHLQLYSTIMMSEAPFLLASVLALWMVMKIDEDKELFKQPALYISLLCIALAYYIRSTGLALFGGIFLWFFLKRNWKAVAYYTAGFFIIAFPWYLRSRKLGGNSYLQPLVMINPYRPDLGNANMHDYVIRFFTNLARYITREIPNSTFPFIKVDYTKAISGGEWLLGLVFAVLIIYGLIKLKNFRILLLAYLLATFGILFLWPEVWTGVRFILPVMPFMLIALLYGIYEFYRLAMKKIKVKSSLNPWLFLILLLFLINPIQELHNKATEPYPANWKNYFEIAKWIKHEGLDSAVVCCRKPNLFYLYSGSFVYTYPYTENDKEIISKLTENKVSYVVLDNLGYRQTYVYLLPAIQKNPTHFETVLKLTNPETYLLKFKP